MTSARSIRVRQKRRRPLLPAGCVIYPHRWYCMETIYNRDGCTLTHNMLDESGVALSRRISRRFA